MSQWLAGPELGLQVGVNDTMNQTHIKIGIDVSKASLEISSFDKGKSSVPNSRIGIRRLFDRMKKLQQPVVICCEATGGYEQLLVELCHEQDIPISVVNGKCVRHFALSKNILAKTDALDAAVLKMFAEDNELRLTPKPTAWMRHLEALLNRRADLNDMITQENNRLENLRDPAISKMIRAHIRSMETQEKRILKEIRELVRSQKELRDFCAKMMSVKGIGLIAATSLFAYLPELGRITDGEAAALAGLAPWCQQSGTWKGERHISGGRSKIRKTLYMPAISASCSNPILKAYYQGMIQRGKPAKVALTAVMRKLVCLANRIATDPEFMPA